MLASKGWEGVIWEGEWKELTSEEIRNPKQEYQSPPKKGTRNSSFLKCEKKGPLLSINNILTVITLSLSTNNKDNTVILLRQKGIFQIPVF